MALRRRRSEDVKEQTENTENGQSQLEFDSQPASYEASESISQEDEDFSKNQENLETAETGADDLKLHPPASPAGLHLCAYRCSSRPSAD